VLLLNGPNLNMLGTRQPEIYGAATLAEIEARCAERAAELGLSLEARQSNHEGELVGWVQQARKDFAAIIINPAALTHTSVALLDALQAFEGLVIEVHLSNIHKRESFRHHSYVSLAATGVIAGLGPQGYDLALQAVAAKLAKP
jgi:3-dehydroquinate dehydratase-2